MYSVTHQKRLAIFLVATFICFGLATKVLAAVIDLPVPTVELQAAANSPTQVFNGLLTSAGPPCTGALSLCSISLTNGADFATAIASGFPAPAVLAEASGNSAAFSQLTYYFELSGPADTTVPITFIGAFTQQGTGDLSQTVSARNFATGTVLLDFGPEAFGPGPFSVEANVISDVVYQVELQAEAALFPLNAVLEIDPTIISISPAFADQFQLILSPGIGNSTTSTPEPSSLILLSTGLLAIGFRGRKRMPRGSLSSPSF